MDEQAKRFRLMSTIPPHSFRPWPLPTATSPVIRLLEEGLSEIPGDQKSELVDEFMRTGLADGTPLIESSAAHPERSIVTFCYRGPGAKLCYLAANRLTDHLDPADTLMRRIDSTDLAYLSVEMPNDWIAGYQFITPPEPLPTAPLHEPFTAHQLRSLSKSIRTDPLARDHLPNKLHPELHSVVALAAAPAVPPVSSAEAWQRTDHAITGPVSESQLPVTIFRHPQAGADAPIVLVLDGEVWLADTILIESLNHAIDAGQIPPVQLVLLHSGGPGDRQLDYACELDESELLLERVADVVEGSLDAPWIIAGSSLGGLYAMLSAVRHRGPVAGAVAQSPSLWWPTDAPMEPVAGRWFTEFADADGASSPVVVQCGLLENTLAGDVLHAREALRSRGELIETPVDLVRGGHDIVWWRRTLPIGLIAQLSRFK
ncbi:enterochelin esterase domain-containing protein [Propionimicrobium sp. PCR01-08-3]|uniref:enterochelin esterase domain-containing protein n=1 Tax=Propionimicrobium sp. PCR01-08-3 TaxID=3052086 RepID=UPI00255C424A|nr:enterochelin esterase domain-containing protein [Propionimicrobium sp. PCR01-08-3]WIY83582.1 DUF3327 domain-containing protein [Propionimicrobium sp. PCR01-08-3]